MTRNASAVRSSGVLCSVILILAIARTFAGQDPPLSVKITSPLGRTGLPGPIRIVAQVRHAAAVVPDHVRFSIDGQLLRSVDEAPYAVEWVDDNPFARREILVEATDGSGHEAHDRIVLEPLEINEAAEVASVLLEASVLDKAGHFVKGLPATAFSLEEDGVPQSLDLVRQEAVGSTYALLVDSSASMSRRMDFVQRTAATLATYMTPLDKIVIAPFSKGLGATTGPTNDRRTIVDAIDAIRPSGGTAILDSLIQVSHAFATSGSRGVIVLVTDGYDEHSVGTAPEALQAIKAAHATVYAIGIGGVAGISLKGQRMLRSIASETGGRAFFPNSDAQLETVHESLMDDVQNRYLITYTSKNQRVDGTWRAIELATQSDFVVRTRPGYFAPKPSPIRPTIEFTARAPDGRYLNLTAEELDVSENGDAQTVDTFQEAVQPVSLVLALDASGSMKRKETQVTDSARRFVEALRPEDSLGLVMFADKSEFAHDLSTSREFSYEAIGRYKALGGTALYDSLCDALLRLKQAPGRRVVVVMTDGRDENNAGNGPGSVRRFDDVVRYQKESGAMIFAIGVGTNVDRVPLEKLAALSGGQALFPEAADQLDAEYRRIVEDLRRRYVVGFTSSHVQRDGSWREVVIRVKTAPDAVVRSPGGYLAPSR